MTSPGTPRFDWQRYPEAEAFLSEKVGQFVGAVPFARALEANLILHTSSRLVDWLDHLVLADGDTPRGQLVDLGFEPQEVPVEPGDVVYRHPGALFPGVLLRTGTSGKPGEVVAAALQVEDVGEFLMIQRVATSIEGTPLSPYRRAQIWQGAGLSFTVVERRGHQGFVPLEMPPDYPQRYLRAVERWATRPRQVDDLQEGMVQTLNLARALASELGADMAAWVAFAAERGYWQRRNRAGQIQKGRQDPGDVGFSPTGTVLCRQRGGLGRAGDGAAGVSLGGFCGR
jgi:hypothetical protein